MRPPGSPAAIAATAAATLAAGVGRRGRRRGRRRRSPRRSASPPRRGSRPPCSDAARARASGRRKPATSLVREHAARRGAAAAAAAGRAPRRAPRRPPGCGRRRARARRAPAAVDQRPAAQPLQPRRPLGAGDARRRRPPRRAPSARSAASAMPAFATWCAPIRCGSGRSRRPAVVLEGHAAVLLPDLPVLALAIASGAPTASARASIAASASGGCGADDAGHAGLEDAGLLAGDLGQRLAEVLLVVERDRGDDRRAAAGRPRWSRRAGRRARPRAARQSAGVSAMARKAAAVVISKKVIGAPAFAASQRSSSGDQPLLVDQLAGEPDALVEAREMRRGVDVHPRAGGLEPGAQHRHHRALAVGAGDVDHRRQPPLGVAERGEQPLDAAERQVDHLGMQRRQALEDAVARRRSWGGRAACAASSARRRQVAVHVGRLRWSGAAAASRARRAGPCAPPPGRACRGRAGTRRAGSPRAASRGSSARSPAGRRSRSARPGSAICTSPSIA